MAKTFSINRYNNADGNQTKSTQIRVVDGETTTIVGIPAKSFYQSDRRDMLISNIETQTSSTLTEDEKTALDNTITSYTFDADLE